MLQQRSYGYFLTSMVLHVYELYGNVRVFYLKQFNSQKKSIRNIIKTNLFKILLDFLRDICYKKIKLKLFYSFILKDLAINKLRLI